MEENFRALDRHTRERIAIGDSAKGQVLDAIFGEHDAIWDNDQGKSFRAFWEFLMSPGRQDELQALLQKTFDLDDIRALGVDNALLPRIKLNLLSAAEKVYQTTKPGWKTAG